MQSNRKLIWSVALLVVVVLALLLVVRDQSLSSPELQAESKAEGLSPSHTLKHKASDAGRISSTQSVNHYVGAQSCQNCHSEQYAQWQGSDHFKAMQLPTSASVLGDFSDVTIRFHGIDNRFYRNANKYMVETLGQSGEPITLEVKHTFGFYPLQQYLVELDDGHIQVLNVAWDSRKVKDGGQRWFHLQPDENITPEHPFYWTKHFQNWNSRCADCHSTNVLRNYSQASNSFATSFSEVNVACEACHGPASQHLALAQSNQINRRDKGTGFDSNPNPAIRWEFTADSAIAKPVGQKHSDDLNMCGSCHSLRGQLVQPGSAGDFHQLNRLQLLNETTYFADGQSKEESFVTGSFLQSKMHHKGVTCGNCHSPHTGKLVVEGNALCTQCHKPEVFDAPKHHHHEVGSEGAQCVNCHMPDRAYMQIDMRRDHSFTIPRPDLSLSLDVPNSCTQCHQNKDDAWAAQQTKDWGIAPSIDHWAYLLRSATQNDVLVTRSVVEAVLDTGLPEMVRASLLQHLAPMPSRVSADLARKSLHDKSPLLRRAAVAALQGQPAELRWQLLSPMMHDPIRSVRMEIAITLADMLGQLPPKQQPALLALLKEYRKSLAVSADSVTTQVNIANLELRLGNFEAAEQAYKQALIIEPSFVPGLLSLADFYRRSERTDEEKPLLDKALKIAPDSGAAQHSVGLYYVRRKNYQTALNHLKLAVEQVDASPYYAYVYSVALENQGQLTKAIDSLKAANQRWPNQYELLMTLVLYYEKSGDTNAALPYLSKLSAIAPGSPAVKELINKLQASK